MSMDIIRTGYGFIVKVQGRYLGRFVDGVWRVSVWEYFADAERAGQTAHPQMPTPPPKEPTLEQRLHAEIERYTQSLSNLPDRSGWRADCIREALSALIRVQGGQG